MTGRRLTLPCWRLCHPKGLRRCMTAARGLADDWQTVDPALLAALPPERVAAMHDSGALALAHALITGAGHWPRLYTSQAPHTTKVSAGQDFLQAFGRAQAADGYVLPVGAERP